MDHKALKLPFLLNQSPDWQCPTCGNGVLRIKKDSFHKDERRDSRDHSHEAWEPGLIQYVYSCLLVCTNNQCREVVASAGVGSVESYIYEDEAGKSSEEYDELFRPQYFEPYLALLTIPEKCPEAVSGPLRESFRLFFSSPSAAANSVRIAIEGLLTELKVKRFNIVKGQRRHLSLNQRITLLPPKHADLRDLVLAIKWLGNAGSHSTGDSKGKITMDDLMNCYEFTEHILQEIYAPKAKKLLALAKSVNKKRGR